MDNKPDNDTVARALKEAEDPSAIVDDAPDEIPDSGVVLKRARNEETANEETAETEPKSANKTASGSKDKAEVTGASQESASEGDKVVSSSSITSSSSSSTKKKKKLAKVPAEPKAKPKAKQKAKAKASEKAKAKPAAKEGPKPIDTSHLSF